MNHLDWNAIKDRIDIVAVTEALLNPPAKREGRRLLWLCPFHDDHHPSFEVDRERRTWRCWACAVGGDAVDLVMKLYRLAFPEASRIAAELSGVVILPGSSPGPASRPPNFKQPTTVAPSGLPLDEASTLVADGVAALWEPGDGDALAYLHGRGLRDETIRVARIGWTPGVMIPKRSGDGRYPFSGVVIPWRDGARLTRIKIRRTGDGKPKYAEAYSNRPLIYPDPEVIQSGRPLIFTEGEFDAMLLAQELPEASVITLGSSSARTDPSVLSGMLSASTWFVAFDADKAGDSAASKFPVWSVRIRPPEPFNDWTEAAQAGVDLRCWWLPRLGGTEALWNHLAGQRWGPNASNAEFPRTKRLEDMARKLRDETGRFPS